MWPNLSYPPFFVSRIPRGTNQYKYVVGEAMMPCTVITHVHGSRNSIEGLTRWSTMIETARDGDEHEGSPSSNRPGIDRTMNDGGGCGCPREHVGPVGRTPTPPTRLSQLRVHFEGIRFPWDPIDSIVWPSPANNLSLLHKRFRQNKIHSISVSTHRIELHFLSLLCISFR